MPDTIDVSVPLTDEDEDFLYEILTSEAVQNMFGLEKVEALLVKLYGDDEDGGEDE